MMGLADPLVDLESALWRASDHLLLHHTNTWELDDALKEAGFEIGPCEVRDHVGLLNVFARKDAHSGPVLARMVNEGRLGKVSGVGFYRYPGGGGAVVDPLIEDLIREEAHFAKTMRSELSDQQIVDHIEKALREAVADTESTLDPQAVAQRLRLTRKGLLRFLS